ncbi:hypothetical protein POTG_02345 [Paenibacillus sp. oral taxon 786 str. D14]|uniref:TipAS antibiotic-recognition domain-containing protein n=1 Tax=unclassified Paenibacillus TaxID=185978 RepID=UPI0001AFDBB0|nr:MULTISPECIES: TipAS antibiotic-recognition domain-containing protein [unclassified Paenibacillus]EES72938.1 hypothetical protein POTG_02345 [Paenibacillus sp. oral taxon 786 str. D14]MCT2194695.1 TipAS antibiotic-recognition domain-containing protein [Paenibacillus sp. p3-SID1389]
MRHTYGVEVPGAEPINVSEMNEQARESMEFTGKLAEALRSGISHGDEEVRQLIERHLNFMEKTQSPCFSG